jgi:hypothetical protein
MSCGALRRALWLFIHMKTTAAGVKVISPTCCFTEKTFVAQIKFYGSIYQRLSGSHAICVRLNLSPIDRKGSAKNE